MILWLAQGFGVGRIPWAPGTFGSIVGVGWFALLLLTHSWTGFLAGGILGVALSTWFCGEGEKILGKKDPGSIVVDEIIAIPLCFISWMAIASARSGSWIGVNYFVRHWAVVAAGFGLFRLFDIWKPWPVRQSQALSGGLGVTIDDLLAAGYVNLVMALLGFLKI